MGFTRATFRSSCLRPLTRVTGIAATVGSSLLNLHSKASSENKARQGSTIEPPAWAGLPKTFPSLNGESTDRRRWDNPRLSCGCAQPKPPSQTSPRVYVPRCEFSRAQKRRSYAYAVSKSFGTLCIASSDERERRSASSDTSPKKLNLSKTLICRLFGVFLVPEAPPESS